MYWNTSASSYGRTSAIEGIMEKEGFTLEELLDEDELIQETKSHNHKLINFLKQKPTLEKVLRYVVDDPQESAQENQKPRYPYVCCEIICCEVEGILSTIVTDDHLMDQLFSIIDPLKKSENAGTLSPRQKKELQQEQNKPSVSAMGYFARAISTLLVKQTMEFMRYLHKNSHLLVKLVKHMHYAGAQEIVLRLCGADENTNQGMSWQHKMWLGEGSILDELIQCMHTSQTQVAIQNAGEVLAAIAGIRPSPINDHLMQPEMLERLCSKIEESKGGVLVPVLTVFICCMTPGVSNLNRSLESGLGGSSASGDSKDDSRLQASRTLANFLPRLVHFLKMEEGEQQELKVPYGVLKPPLGLKRLKIVEFIATIVSLGDPQSLAKIVEIEVVQRCLDLFRQYPHNSLLHCHVSNMIQSGTSSNEEDFKLHIFQDCGLVDWLTTLPAKVTVQGNDKLIYASYQGHIISIAELLCHLATDDLQIQQYLEKEEQWPIFFVNVLQPSMDRNDTKNWRCGRPSILLLGEDWSDSRKDDDDDEDHDIVHDQGGTMKVPTPYRPVGLDDQDGEGEEDDEEEEGEVSEEEGFWLGHVDENDNEIDDDDDLCETGLDEPPVKRNEDELAILPTRLNFEEESSYEDDDQQYDDDDDLQDSVLFQDKLPTTQEQQKATTDTPQHDQFQQKTQQLLQQQYQQQQQSKQSSSDDPIQMQVIIQDIVVGDQEEECCFLSEGSSSGTSETLDSSSDGSGTSDTIQQESLVNVPAV